MNVVIEEAVGVGNGSLDNDEEYNYLTKKRIEWEIYRNEVERKIVNRGK